jgi:TPR repeat protein
LALLVTASVCAGSPSYAAQPKRIIVLAYIGDPDAIIKLRKAAGKGDAEAQDVLGELHLKGGSLPLDYTKAVMWFRKSAEQGDADGQIDLACSYYNGQGVPQDYAKAFFWYHKAAEKGNADAEKSVGYLYATGQGVPQDYEKSVIWYSKAANGGDASAQFELGAAYYQGEGVPQDYTQAVVWYRKAAEQAYPHAQGALGAMYMQGDGVPQDYIKAYKWFDLAKAFSKSNGKLYKAGEMSLSILSIRMTKGQIAQAQKEATDWFDKYNKKKAAEAKNMDAKFAKKYGSKNIYITLSQAPVPPKSMSTAQPSAPNK